MLSPAALWFVRCLLLAGLVACSGCVQLSTTQSGFLRDYGQLRPATDGTHQLVASQPGWQPAEFTRVWIEPTEVRLPAKDKGTISAKESIELAAYCDATLKKVLTAHRIIATENAPGTLRVRAAITGVATSNPALNVATGVLLWPVDYGGISLEFEVLNSSNHEQLVALVCFSKGTPLQLIGSFSRLGHARNGINRWVAVLDKLLAPPAVAQTNP